ncbi:alpha-E domain-containing protein [Propylenella binzhouense]|uniref:Alpha-E domain-containing protein n=1 Tax=Propylenella binzhouense TaxID=2555902 RepID=A0A964WSZ3_9HYPH|nr:alpha-E domain-containing protein [Propylenella binzhouense]MYZ47482.1 alpha-E domain-containing protein [Propylenella binzhouense]
MLGRTASSLFWMSRYMERAENMARLTEAGFRMTLTNGEGHGEEWRSTLQSAGVMDGYVKKHGDRFATATVVDFLLFDADNPSSVRSCLSTARNNARFVRTKITRDMWEAMNSTWLSFEEVKPTEVSHPRLPEFLDWVRERTALFRGALLGTILRDDTYYFSQLGAFIERADNTARIMDVKYFILLPINQPVGGDIDTLQWEMILRAVSAHRAYRHVFDEQYRAASVAEFLILRPEMPRSLRFCYDWLSTSVEGLATHYGERSPSADVIAETRAMLRDSDMQAIFRQGLHEFLCEFVARNNQVTAALSRDYHFG